MMGGPVDLASTILDERGGSMKFVVVGSGAIGCFYGSLLARAGEDVTFVARGNTLTQLQQQDLIVQSIWGDYSMPVHAIDTTKLHEVQACDYVLLTVKSTALADVMGELDQLVTKKTKIVCVLNGIGNEEILADRFGEETIIGASAFASVIVEQPGFIRHVASGDIMMGSWNNQSSESLQLLARAFQRAGVNVILADNMKKAKWEKLLWNISYNPITALTRKTVGEAIADPQIYHIMNRVTEEYLNVVESIGMTFEEEMKSNVLYPNEFVRNHKTSMLQDLESGRKMELDSIMGHVIRVAKEQNVLIPTIESMYYLLKDQERTAM